MLQSQVEVLKRLLNPLGVPCSQQVVIGYGKAYIHSTNIAVCTNNEKGLYIGIYLFVQLTSIDPSLVKVVEHSLSFHEDTSLSSQQRHRRSRKKGRGGTIV